jgi:hypothetical protein
MQCKLPCTAVACPCVAVYGKAACVYLRFNKRSHFNCERLLFTAAEACLRLPVKMNDAKLVWFLSLKVECCSACLISRKSIVSCRWYRLGVGPLRLGGHGRHSKTAGGAQVGTAVQQRRECKGTYGFRHASDGRRLLVSSSRSELKLVMIAPD